MSQREVGEQYLKLTVDNQNILIPLIQVQIVLRLPALQEVPSQAKGFQGILNYHGVGVPVYGLDAWINSGQSFKYTVDTPLILCELEGDMAGFLVSDVHDVLHIEADEIQNPGLSHLPDFVSGVYESEQLSMWVMNLAAVIQHGHHAVGSHDES